MARFSLVRGGPFFRLLGNAQLDDADGASLLARAAVFAGFAWIPIALADRVEYTLTGNSSGLLRDASVHTRALVAIPLLFAAEALLDERCAHTIHRARKRLSSGKDRVALARIVAHAEYRRDSPGTDALFAAGALLFGAASVWGVTAPSEFIEAIHFRRSSFAYQWYGLVTLPLFLFLLFRWLWRWTIWSLLLRKMARLDLHPIVTHPDRAGGLGWLSEPLPAFALFLFAATSVVGAAWATQMVAYGMRARSFATEFGALLVAGLAIGLVPLLCFAPALYRARLRGHRKYHELTDDFVRYVDRRWNDGDVQETSVMGHADSTALADADFVYQNLERMRLLPFESRYVLSLLLGMILPVLPLIAIEVPLGELLHDLGGVLLGGVTH